MRLLLDSHVPADVAAAVLKLKPSGSVEHVSSWQEGVWRNVDDDLLLEACHEDRRVLVSKDRRTAHPMGLSLSPTAWLFVRNRSGSSVQRPRKRR